MKIILAIFTVLIFNLNSFASEPWLNGKVMEIVDGDTIKVKIEMQRELYANTISYEDLPDMFTSVKLSSIDAPEAKQRQGRFSTRFLRKKLLFKEVRLIEDGSSTTPGLMTARVWYEIKKGGKWQNINEEMVREGMAWVDRFTFDENLRRLEMKAKEKKKGIFADENPMPPWIFREKRNKLKHKILSWKDCRLYETYLCVKLSCREAMHLLNNCARTDLDPDRDGVPCERTACSNQISYTTNFDIQQDD